MSRYTIAPHDPRYEVVVGWDPRQWRVYFSYEGDTFFNAINGVEATPLGVTNVSTALRAIRA